MHLKLAFFAIACWPFSDIIAQRRAMAVEHGSSLEQTVDPAIKPGDDFFAYANGAWLKAAVIPAGRDRRSVRDDVTERTRRQIVALFDDARSSPPGSLARKVADFRSALLNHSASDANSVRPLAPTLSRIDAIGDKLALARFLGTTMPADVDPLNLGVYTSSSVLGMAVEHSIHGEPAYTAFLVQGGLGLGDRDEYLSNDAAHTAKRTRYHAYVARLLSLAGFDRSDARADSVLALETAIARSHATTQASSVDRNADNQWSGADFERDAPGVDWSVVLGAAGLGAQKTVVVWQPSAVKGFAALVSSRSLDTWKDYLRFHVLHTYADELPRAFADAAADMRGDSRTRDERAQAITETSMSDAIGQLYAARYFSAEQKARVRHIIANVAAAFREHVARAPWLSPASRRTALEKLDHLYVGIGYPDARDDFSTLIIDPQDAVGDAQRIASRNREHALEKLTKPYDQHEWVWPAQIPGAVLVFQQNAYEFAAALLQSPKYDSTMSDAAAYGAIGAIIGHDMSHFVDVLGADYEPNGAMHHWWTTDDSLRFEAAAAPLDRQFAAYEPFPGVHVDGRLTRTENVADLAGLTAAFEAYRRSLGRGTTDSARLRRGDREFFIAFAQAFAAKLSDTAVRAQLATDHAPEMYRFNTVRNIDAWYDAFDVKPGDRLYVEPSARVHIW